MDRLRVGRRSVLGGMVAVLGSMAGCTWDEGDEADSDPEPVAEFGYGGKPVVDDGADDRQVDESRESGRDDEDDRSDGRDRSNPPLLIGGSGGGDGDDEKRLESTLGVGEQGYGKQGYGGVKLDEA